MRFSKIILALAAIDERGGPEIADYLRRLHASGLLAIAPDVPEPLTFKDSVTALIGLSACVSSIDAPIAVRNFRPLPPMVRTGVAPERYFPPGVMEAETFGEALERLIEGLPVLEAKCSRHALRFEAGFYWGSYDAGALRLYAGRALQAEIVFMRPDASAADDFYDQRRAVVVGLRTFHILHGLGCERGSSHQPVAIPFRARAAMMASRNEGPSHVA